MATRLLTAALLATTLALNSGCSTPVEGTGTGASTVVYGAGEMKAREYVSYDKAWDAALAALNDLGHAVTDKEKTGVEGKITARAPGDRKITVRVNKISGTQAEFRIRFGGTGDQFQSQQILDAIRKRL